MTAPEVLVCSDCGSTYSAAVARWRCDCGKYLRLQGTGMFDPRDLSSRTPNLWRYREALGVDSHITTLGEGFTPLVAASVAGLSVLLKLDFLCPTGSHKDRGSAV